MTAFVRFTPIDDNLFRILNRAVGKQIYMTMNTEYSPSL